MNRIFVALFLVLSMQLYLAGQSDPVPIIPIRTEDQDVPLLRSKIDLLLQDALVSKLNENAKWKRLISENKLAIGVVDLSDPNNVKFARVNGNVMMYAASLPKIAILLATMDALENDEIQDSRELRAKLEMMIGSSSNSAATYMIDKLGYEKIERVLKDPKYRLYDEDYGGGLWVGKRYAASGKKYPDPIKGLSHAATVSQVCRFYYLMAMGKLVSYERSQQMLDLMDDPKLHHKFVNTLGKIAPGAKLYRKSGTWKSFHADSILVWGPEWRRYILVALVEDPGGEKIMRNMIKPVEDALRQSNQRL